jgi:hypothetical protein
MGIAGTSIWSFFKTVSAESHTRLTCSRLYDLRAGHDPVVTYHDPVDEDSAVYSLAAFGQERFLAGTASHILKLFDFRNGSKVYQYTDGLSCSKRELPASSGGDYTRYPELPRNPNQTESKVLVSDLQTMGIKDALAHEQDSRCRYDIPDAPPQICNFHRLSRLDKYRPNMNMYLYGRTPGNNGQSISSPIFSLSSPHPLCPIVYAGTAGKITELEIAEFNVKGDVLDPWFAATPGAALERWTPLDILAMYETDDGRSPRRGSGMRDTPSKLWWNGEKPNWITKQAERTRLDSRWLG